jgi:membrane protein implicated in regulation of membrane protease activity
VGFLFLISSLSKIKSFPQYANSVREFQLLPKLFTPLVATIVLISELLVVLFLFRWQVIAFSLASVLLVIFSVALASVLFRNIQVNCNCFGASQHTVSQADLLRNFGFLLCSCGGACLATKPELTYPITPLTFGITGFVSLAFFIIWAQLGEIYRLFQPN